MLCPSCGTENEDGTESCSRCGREIFSLTEGTVLASRYEILALLGRGGMGIVYRARDRELDETVALKVLRPEAARSEEMARRFRSEIKLARKVRHRNVCGIHEYGQEGDLRFIAMELVDGVDLKAIVRQRGAFPAEDAFNTAVQVAKGLQAIHEVGVVHRDLKTSNIMRDARGLVRLMDFGIAKDQSAGAADATLTGQIVGTPEYMSPEQARGQKIDQRSDIYSLGIVLFELFTGVVPFRGESPIATIFMHLQREPPLDHLALPAQVVPVLRRALAKDPAERYTSAREMLDGLRRARAESFPERYSALSGPQAVVGPEDLTADFGDETLPGPTLSAVTLPAAAAAPTQVPVARELLATGTTGGGGVVEPRNSTAPPAPLRRPPPPVARPRPVVEERVRPPTEAPRPRGPAPSLIVGGALVVGVIIVAFLRWPTSPESPHPAPSTAPVVPLSASSTPSAVTAPSAPPPILAPPATAPPAPSLARSDEGTKAGALPAVGRGRAATAPTGTVPRVAPPIEPLSPPSTAATAPPASTATTLPASFPPPAIPPTLATARPVPVASLPAWQSEAAVRQAITDYVAAFASLDRKAIQRVYPSISKDELNSLKNFQAYDVEIDVRAIDVQGDRAVVSCRMAVRFKSFAGKEHRLPPRDEKLILLHRNGSWVRVP